MLTFGKTLFGLRPSFTGKLFLSSLKSTGGSKQPVHPNESQMHVELLEHRLNQLEDRVLGRNRTTASTVSSKQSLFDLLATTHSALLNAEKRPGIGRVLSRTTEIQKYLEPGFFDRDSLSTKAKAEIILAENDKIRETAAALEKISTLTDVVNHPAFRALGSLRQKLEQLRGQFTTQEQVSNKFITDAQSLLENYFSLMFDLSKLFVAWNQRTNAVTD